MSVWQTRWNLFDMNKAVEEDLYWGDLIGVGVSGRVRISRSS